MDDITLIGHSMGAHISGFAGAYLNGKVQMIIGLDPGMYFSLSRCFQADHHVLVIVIQPDHRLPS